MAHPLLLRDLGWVACATLCGCSFFVPDARTPADRARAIEVKCHDLNEGDARALLSPEAIDAVEPAYSYVTGGPNGRDAHLRGARLHLRPLPGLSRESLTRSLECHEARVTLGSVLASAGDPYALRDRWLSIDVESEGDGFVALVRTDDLDAARRVLDRARLFLASRAHSDAPSAPASSGGQPPPLQ